MYIIIGPIMANSKNDHVNMKGTQGEPLPHFDLRKVTEVEDGYKDTTLNCKLEKSIIIFIDWIAKIFNCNL